MPELFRYELISKGAAVLCALSGGADSMYLLCRLLEGAGRGGYTVQAAHYDHRLRAESGRDADFVRAQCAEKGVPLTVGQGDVASEAARLGLGLEECARQMRYAFLEETAKEECCALIATGHHAGDNGETVLMNLIRGCGLNGLTGIPERRGNLIRPMLTVTRADIEAYLTDHNVPHVEDETNGDETYTRNKIRHQLLPLLCELNPQAAEHICATARRLDEDERELSRQASLLAEQAEEIDDGVAIAASLLADAPRPIAIRAVRQLLDRAGLSGYAVHLEGVLALAAGDDPSARLDLPVGMAYRAYERLVLSKAAMEPPAPMAVAEGKACWGRWTVSCERSVCPVKAYLSRREFHLRPADYTIRARQTGDEIKLGRRPAKTVKKLFIDEKVPAMSRAFVPVLADGEGAVAALGGFGPDAAHLAQPGQSSLHIILTEEKPS
jgi:tRNA(Ile)-lysidine synthase